MTHFLSLPLASFLGLGGAEIGIIFAVAGMLFGGIMGLAGMYFHHQRQRLWHETARIALERGQPVPLAPKGEGDDEASARDNLRHHDLRGGLVLIAVGAGLFLFLRLVTAPGSGGVAFVGAIPAFIGVALLLNHVITVATRPKKSDSTTTRS